MDVGILGELSEDAGGNLDGDRPLRDRAYPIDVGVGVGVDDHDVFGSRSPGHAGGAVDECDQGVAGEELLFLDRILRTPLGYLLREHRLHRRRRRDIGQRIDAFEQLVALRHRQLGGADRGLRGVRDTSLGEPVRRQLRDERGVLGFGP